MQAVDFLDKLLRYDHQERLTAREAMVCFYSLMLQAGYKAVLSRCTDFLKLIQIR